MNSKLAVITFFLLFVGSIVYSFDTFKLTTSIQDPIEHGTHSDDEADDGHVEEQGEAHGDDHGAEHSEEHGHPGLDSLFFIILALIIGAATRHFLKKSPLPFTVMLLIFGLVLGYLTREGYFDLWNFGFMHIDVSIIHNSMEWAANINPHLLLFVFLPVLIFEAAFAMDVHVFKKSVTNAAILAVPGICVALGLTGAMVIGCNMAGLGFEGWGWPMALMFGAVISATDPVAVVALLKELGASKKLGTLIEGESLLNDGTAIVIFMVFFLGITGMASDTNGFVEFLYVAVGGAIVGLVIGGIVLVWVKKVFNDALVEISVIVAAAYMAFFAAEHFMHVSGVLALVALGLVMAGVGKTRISPEVEHFMHEFWELAGFIANCLLFLIVGVVIAIRVEISAENFMMLGIIYIGIHVIRAIVITLFYPLMKNAGYGLPVKDAIVVWYGALRGAIGLALALIVADAEAIPIEIRDQFLFLIAGTVTLTLLVNATTIKYLVNKLGLTDIPAVKALMVSNAYQDLATNSESGLELLKSDRFMSGANWNAVREFIPVPIEFKISKEELAKMDTKAEIRRRILEKEKSSYWHQFKDGMLGPVAVRRLSDGINEVLDQGGSIPLNDREYLEALMTGSAWAEKLENAPVVGGFAKKSLAADLEMSYDISRGFIVAQEEVIKLVDSMSGEGGDIDMVNEVKGEITKNRLRGLNFLKEIREGHPEMAVAVETKQAIRSILNDERSMVKKLLGNGRIESDEAEKMLHSVEARMKNLVDSPPSIELLNPIDILSEVSWLNHLESSDFDKVKALAEEKTYAAGEKLMEKDGPGDGLFVVARGTVKVAVGDYVVDILGPGSVIGEMAVLTGGIRTADVIAESSVIVLFLNSHDMQTAMQSSPDLKNNLWDTAGKRFAENFLSKISPYKEVRQFQLRSWLMEGETLDKEGTKHISSLKGLAAVLLTGSATVQDTGEVINAPAVIDSNDVEITQDAHIFVCEEKLLGNID